MPDALQILREDHRKVKDIFRQFEDAEDQQTKKALVDQALTELTVHTQLEEEIFYPAVRSEGDTGDLIDEAEEEHHVAEMLIEELRRMRPSDERYDAKFKVLSEAVKMHIEEEEANTLPKAAELGPEALQRIGQQMDQRRPLNSRVRNARNHCEADDERPERGAFDSDALDVDARAHDGASRNGDDPVTRGHDEPSAEHPLAERR